MKFGMNLLLWTGDATGETYLPLFEKLKKMGFDGVEIPLFNMKPELYAALGRHLDNLGLQRTGVTVRGPEDDPMSPDPKVRALGVAHNKIALDCCQAGGMTVLAGPYHSAIGLFSGKGPEKSEWDRAVGSARELAGHAAACGVTLAYEFLNRFECYLLNCAGDAVRFVQEVGHPSCRTMWDTFHAHIEEKNTADAIRTMAPVMAHVHISENDRSTPGCGQVNWKTTFDTILATGYDGWMTVEAFGQSLPELVAATKIWRRMYENEEKLAADALAFMKTEVERRT
ncbi:MAG: sugar phosphate isomerase/epimerase [Candidatus Omnitrophica bacterium]|nr:sugar phosphate isomerase/epimerase [Candidatus Omnitrophota bacterium]